MTHFRLSAWLPAIWGVILMLITLINTQNTPNEVTDTVIIELIIIVIALSHSTVLALVAIYLTFKKQWQYFIQAVLGILLLLCFVHIASFGAGFSQ
jgi:hypothetical protein